MDGSSSISVAVRVRPFSEKESILLSSTFNAGPTLFVSDPSSSSAHFSTPQPPRSTLGNNNSTGALRKVVKCLDDRILVFDPPETNPVSRFQHKAESGMPVMGKKVKDIRFCFDRVFDEDCGQEEVYDGSAKELVGHVMNGFHSTVFAYGATGCGKTHTISGSQTQPGIVFLIMKDLFARIGAKSTEIDFSLTVSYLEVYNETIRDLLAPESGPLALRESEGSARAAGLSTKEPTCATDVVEWITLGNQNRTVNATEANATSSRSHAVLSVTVTQKPRAGGLTDNTSTASLTVIDLAGSERASVTKNKGERLIEGANINRSLLALGNCINALCDPRKRGHVPYRDSKLTRLLKQSLGGNCKTVMIVCVSPSSSHYDETHNTLQYANRAKEIKTKAVRNVISVDRHVAQYCQQILEQQRQIDLLKAQLDTQTSTVSVEDREEDTAVVRKSMMKLRLLWEYSKSKVVESTRAGIEKQIAESVRDTLTRWRTAALGPAEATSPTSTSSSALILVTDIKSPIDSLLAKVSHEIIPSLAAEEARGSGALATYSAVLATITTSIRSNRPTALPLFQLEVKLLESALEVLKAEAKSEAVEKSASLYTRAMFAMCEARSLIGVRDMSEVGVDKLITSIDLANKDAFLALSNGTIKGSLKRAATLSPLLPEASSSTLAWGGNHLSPRKAARASLASSPGRPNGLLSPLKKAGRVMVARLSPRKGVSLPRRAMGGPSPKKRKEVQWKDEAGEGWDLEEYPDEVSIDSVQSSASNVSISSAGTIKRPTPSFTVTRPPAAARSASIPIVPSAAATSSAAQMAAAVARRRSATTTLRHKASSLSITAPAPITTTPKPFSFLDGSSTRPPFGDLANTSISSTSSAPSASSVGRKSFSMAPTPSGLIAPLEKKPVVPDTPRRAAARARRLSTTIGPQRSSKPNRRTSFIAPPTPAGSLPRAKPGRLLSSSASAAYSSSSSSSSSSLTIPGSLRKSPRKVHLSLNAVRRNSALPLGSATGTAPLFPGSKSQARIEATRAALVKDTAVGGSGGGGAAMRTLGRESMPPKAGIWR